jgi:hypothetical protein
MPSNILCPVGHCFSTFALIREIRVNGVVSLCLGCSIRDPVWIEPKNLKKDIALEGVFGKLHARFQTEGGEI